MRAPVAGKSNRLSESTITRARFVESGMTVPGIGWRVDRMTAFPACPRESSVAHTIAPRFIGERSPNGP
jgi:hypothetical protein